MEDRTGPRRDLSALEKGAGRNPMKLKGKCNILRWSQDAHCRTGWGQLARKHLELPKSSRTPGWPGLSSEGRTHHGLGEQEDSQQGEDRHSSVPPRPQLQFCVLLRTTQWERCQLRPPKWSGLGHRTSKDRLRGTGFGQLKVTKLRGILLLSTLTQWKNGEKLEPYSSWRCTGIGQETTDQAETHGIQVKY